MLNKSVIMMVVILALLLAACGAVATPVWEKPPATATVENTPVPAVPTKVAIEAATATMEPATATPVPPTVTFTPVPPTAAPAVTPSPMAMNMDMGNQGKADDPIVFLVSVSDPENGKKLFNTFFDKAGYMCATCHRVDSTERLIGPGLLHISEIGTPAHSMPGMPNEIPERYIYNSITNPSAYVVPGYPDNLMPKVWAQVFTEQQLYDIIAYLMSLK